MTLEDTIWLAGFVDGEGYIGVVKKGSRFQAQLRISTTHKATMEYVASLFGSPLHNIYRDHPRWKDQYLACIYDEKAADIIRQIRPYLKTKALQADVLLAFRETITPKGHWQLRSNETHWVQTGFYLRCRELNKKGKVDAAIV